MSCTPPLLTAGCVEVAVSVMRYYGGYTDKIHGYTIPIGRLYKVKSCPVALD